MAEELKSSWRIRLSKSPFWPAILSGLVAPGVGQIVNKEVSKGVLLLVASIGSFLWFSKIISERLMAILPGSPDQWAMNQNAFRDAVLKVVNENPDMFTTFQWLMLLVWGFSVVDAYITARKRLQATPPLTTPPTDESDDSIR